MIVKNETFRHLKNLGAGDYGQVCLVERIGVGDKVAMKILNDANPSAFVEKFTESLALGKLKDCEHVANVIHAGILSPSNIDLPIDGERAYILMRYYSNGSCHELLTKLSWVPVSQSLKYGLEVLTALSFAHDKNILHRDIKPANILLSEYNKAVLSDFGLCQTLNANNVASGAGGLYYIAPETLKESTTSYQTDIYSMGVTLFMLINGLDFLNSYDFQDVLYSIPRGKFPPRRPQDAGFRPFVYTKLQTILRKAMNINPNDRYLNVREFRQDIENYLKVHQVDWILDDNSWYGKGINKDYEILQQEKKTGIQIEIMQGKNSLFRRVPKLCRKNLNTNEAEAYLKLSMTHISVNKLDSLMAE